MSTEQLAAMWAALKEERDTIDAQLNDVGAQLAEALEHPDEGSKTHQVGDYKVTLTGRVNRTIDGDKWYTIRNGIPKTMWPVREKLSADARGCRYLADKHPELWAVAATAITEKPGKPGVAVKREDA